MYGNDVDEMRKVYGNLITRAQQ